MKTKQLDARDVRKIVSEQDSRKEKSKSVSKHVVGVIGGDLFSGRRPLFSRKTMKMVGLATFNDFDNSVDYDYYVSYQKDVQEFDSHKSLETNTWGSKFFGGNQNKVKFKNRKGT